MSIAISTYNLGSSSRIDDILYIQFRQVSFAESGTISGVKLSGKTRFFFEIGLEKKLNNYNELYYQ